MPTSFETALGADAADTTATAFRVAVGGWAHGNLVTGTDRDMIAVDLVAGQSYSFAMTGVGTTALANCYLRLVGTNGLSLLATGYNNLLTGNAQFSFTATTTGTHYLRTSSANSLPGDYAVSVFAGAETALDEAMLAGLLAGQTKWATPTTGPLTLTFGFSQSVTRSLGDFSQFTDCQKEAVRHALQQISDATGLVFTEVNPGSTTNAATLLFGNYSAADGSGGQAWAPGSVSTSSSAGDVFLNKAVVDTGAFATGDWSYHVLLQKIAVALGLAPAASLSSAVTLYDKSPFQSDSQHLSVMGAVSAGDLLADTLGLYDFMVLQSLYGAGTGVRTDASTYGFGSNIGGIFDFEYNIDPRMTILDQGGVDVLDCSRFAAGQTISLTAGTLSSVGGYVDNLAIAFGTEIENAMGGRGHDRLMGNDLANILAGSGGNDSVYGGNGADTLSGGTGRDSLYGGAGNDLLSGEDHGVPPPPLQTYQLVSTNSATGAAVEVLQTNLFPTGSFTFEFLWRQDATSQPGLMVDLGGVQISRTADGKATIVFSQAAEDSVVTGAIPAIFSDGQPHRISISYDDATGMMAVFIDGAKLFSTGFTVGTRGLPPVGDIRFGDTASVGDVRIFDSARSAQEIWDWALIPLANPSETPGLLSNWQGQGSGGLINALPPFPDMLGIGPVTPVAITLGSSSGGNTLAGGAGDDHYLIRSSTDRIIELVGEGTDTAEAMVSFTLSAAQHVEILKAKGSAALVLRGNELANRLVGSTFNGDTLYGGAGDDTYYLYNAVTRVSDAAGGGVDRLYAYANHQLGATAEIEYLIGRGSVGLRLTGNALNNRIYGTTKADTIEGGAGKDYLHAGTDSLSDRFVFRTIADSVLGTNRDTVVAFTSGSDVIDLSLIDANTALAGNQAFLPLGSAAQANAVWTSLSGTTLILHADVTGDGLADMQIGLSGVSSLLARDVLL
jgi:serralysin